MMFGVDGLKRNGAKAAGDGRMEAGTDALSMLKLSKLDVVGSNGRGLGSAGVHGGVGQKEGVGEWCRWTNDGRGLSTQHLSSFSIVYLYAFLNLYIHHRLE